MFRAVVLIAAVVLAADQATKYWAESALSDGQTITVLGELLQLHLVYNPGAAFSIGTAYTWIFAVFAAAAVVAVTVVARRVTSRAWAVALGLVLGGAATHLLDRLFREPGFARGHVVDFIDYAGFFVGNVADIALVVGVGIVMLLNVRGVPLRDTASETREQASSSGS
ncbi:signal peptidase II [Micromonospora violae]|uniref:Lipoprotein signal peptidase n=1 Tax=Micromonospora violae TaxID=1278207 RepID=A0A4Q7UDA3_9ACTN|nr:signal peptidase II [Micromonospora violae]RZT79197.1 signal peptidase II [Micromonospora violae]